MNILLDEETFKQQVKVQHRALKARGIKLKLSDVYESLAIAYGYANHNEIQDLLKSEGSCYVEGATYLAQTQNHFVVSRFTDEESEDCEEYLGVYPPGTTITDVGTRNYGKLAALREDAVIFEEGFVLSADTVGLETFCILPNVEKYGVTPLAHEMLAAQAIREDYGFRTPLEGVMANFHDSGDDTSETINMLIWVTDADAEVIRAMFSK